MFFWFSDFINLFYPQVCAGCNNGLFKGESVLCTQCLYHLPKTNFHRFPGNPVEKQFWGKVPVHAATALYYFSKGGRVQHLIHRLKYHGEKEVGIFTGSVLGRQLSGSDRFNTAEIVVPVPLHSSKRKIRGFNQAEFFASGIAASMGIRMIPDFLIREKATATQTHKSRYERFMNVDRIFKANPNYDLKACHFLLVDDVITTGSTLSSCVAGLLEIPGSKVSIATMAYAKL